VVRAINDAYTSKKLPVTQTQGVVTCIPKENKPKQFVKNWRPITLLNTVYKIGAVCIIKIKQVSSKEDILEKIPVLSMILCSKLKK
jgi:hypothetical protein